MITRANCLILPGDVRRSLRNVAERSIHNVVTSPPYWALRSYLAADHPLKYLELGSEPTPAFFVENLVGVFREVRRVLRDDGSCFVNLGDSYAREGGNGGHGPNAACGNTKKGVQRRNCVLPPDSGLKSLDQVLVPHQFALAMRADGWYLRDTIVWQKPAPMPLSIDGWRWERCRVKVKSQSTRDDNKKATPDGDAERQATLNERYHEGVGRAEWIDCAGCEKCRTNDGMVLRRGSWRTTTAHEYIFHFTKTADYYGDRDAVATPAASSTLARNKYCRVLDDPEEQHAVKHDHEYTGATANLRSVWLIGAEPTSEKHYAAFPSEIPERCILATTSPAVCASCGAPRARIVERERESASNSGRSGCPPVGKQAAPLLGGGETTDVRNGPQVISKTRGWRPTCACASADAPAVVLDPFGGTGRTAIAAIRNGRRAILCELNPESVDIAARCVGEALPMFTTVEIFGEKVGAA